MTRPSAVSMTWIAQGTPSARYCPNAGRPFARTGTRCDPSQPSPGPRSHFRMSARPRSHRAYGGMDSVESSCSTAVSASMSNRSKAST